MSVFGVNACGHEAHERRRLNEQHESEPLIVKRRVVALSDERREDEKFVEEESRVDAKDDEEFATMKDEEGEGDEGGEEAAEARKRERRRVAERVEEKTKKPERGKKFRVRRAGNLQRRSGSGGKGTAANCEAVRNPVSG